jgi:two-component system nitrate/nitrite response regulator NarL
MRISKRQSDVWACIALGLSDKAIARQLGIAPGSVRTHRYHLYARLGVHSKVQAALLWGKAA